MIHGLLSVRWAMKQSHPVWMQLLPWTLSGLLAGILLVVWFGTTAAPQLRQSPPVFIANREVAQRTFRGDSALMVRFVRPEMADQYEASLASVKQALTRSSSPTRRQQAAGWRVFRALQTATNGDLVYVFEIDRPVAGADYAVSTLLAESFPEQAGSLYRRYAESYSGPQNILDLQLVDGFTR